MKPEDREQYVKYRLESAYKTIGYKRNQER